MKSPSQEDVAYDLGVVLPPKDRHLLPKSHNVPKPKAGYGTRIYISRFSLTSFFKKHRYPLKEQYISAKIFRNVEEFRNYLHKNVEESNDQMICFNWRILKKNRGIVGHCILVERVGEKAIYLHNPGFGHSRDVMHVSIRDLFNATRKHYKGGIWVISRK